jgi:hypothetical protein
LRGTIEALYLPHARHVFAQRSGHYVMFDRPRLVIREIRRVADSVAAR